MPIDVEKALAADLAVNKPLGLSPPGIEFKRAHLYDINPVGVGAMAAVLGYAPAAPAGTTAPLASAGAQEGFSWMWKPCRPGGRPWSSG